MSRDEVIITNDAKVPERRRLVGFSGSVSDWPVLVAENIWDEMDVEISLDAGRLDALRAWCEKMIAEETARGRGLR